MPYLVDGHNLIPKISGLSLQALDDELQLIELLQEFCRLKGKQVEVYFDNAPPGPGQVRKYACVIARFIRQGTSADDAIRLRLKRLGRGASSWTVVSSDRMVQAAAREAHAQVFSSEEFAQQLKETLETRQSISKGAGEEAGLSPEEVENWLKIFRGKKDSE
jgi:predicted RNA-binding protein with PIN domain